MCGQISMECILSYRWETSASSSSNGRAPAPSAEEWAISAGLQSSGKNMIQEHVSASHSSINRSLTFMWQTYVESLTFFRAFSTFLWQKMNAPLYATKEVFTFYTWLLIDNHSFLWFTFLWEHQLRVITTQFHCLYSYQCPIFLNPWYNGYILFRVQLSCNRKSS